jgi:hypothetical protein
MILSMWGVVRVGNCCREARDVRISGAVAATSTAPTLRSSRIVCFLAGDRHGQIARNRRITQ